MYTSEGNFIGAIVAGAATALLCAVVWGIISILTGYQIGWIAVGVGFAVGVAVRVVGNGDNPIFGIVAGTLSLLAVVLGNVICIAGVLANLSGSDDMPEKISVFSAFFRLLMNPGLTMELLKLTFSPMDIIFYGIALYVGFKTAIGGNNDA